MPLLRHCNTGRTCYQLPINTRENTSLCIHVVQNITIICAGKQKIRGLGNLILCSVAIWWHREKFEQRVHNYKS